MMKTADEIKEGLKCYSDQDGCAKICDVRRCPYADVPSDVTCGEIITKHALAYIQQLEARNNAMYNTILSVMHFVDKWLDCPDYDPDKDLNGVDAVTRAVQAREIALKAIEKLEAERDAAVACIPRECGYCKHDGTADFDVDSVCDYCLNGNTRWEWRGVQKEDSND